MARPPGELVTPGGRLLPRPLRPAERVLSVDDTLDLYDLARDELVRLIRERLLVVALAVAQRRPPPYLSVRELHRLLSVLWTLYEMGRAEAVAEMHRLGLRPVIVDPDSARRFARASLIDRFRRVLTLTRSALTGGKRYPSGLARTYARLVSRLATLERDLQFRSSDPSLAGKPEREVADRLVKLPGILSAAGDVVTEPYTTGLADMYESQQQVLQWEYSSVLDGGTCPSCSALDGTRYDSLQALYAVLPAFGPNPQCFGRWRCRCRGIPVGEGE